MVVDRDRCRERGLGGMVRGVEMGQEGWRECGVCGTRGER